MTSEPGSATSQCGWCGSHVQPTPEGYCPSCTRQFVVAEDGQTDFEFFTPKYPPTLEMPGCTKIVIVLFVFPVFAQLITFLWGFGLYFVPASSQATLATPFVVLANVIGIVGSFFICRHFWPKEEPPFRW